MDDLFKNRWEPFAGVAESQRHNSGQFVVYQYGSTAAHSWETAPGKDTCQVSSSNLKKLCDFHF